ncbi:MAG: Ig-like domain-containing protein [Pseudomonadales bacterium]|nr:Ig-like domain-containing protein [Pseudomonadales bacterium]
MFSNLLKKSHLVIYLLLLVGCGSSAPDKNPIPDQVTQNSLLILNDLSNLFYGDANFTLDVQGAGDGNLFYESSDPAIAIIDSQGLVQILIAGSVSISVIEKTSELVEIQSISFVLEINKSKSGQTNYQDLTTSDINKLYGVDNFSVEYTGGNAGVISYQSSDNLIASIDLDGEITVHKVGTITITINEAESSNFVGQSNNLELVINKSQSGQTNYQDLTTSNINTTYGAENFTINYTGSNGGEISYVSSDVNIASIDVNGEVTVKALGEVTITINEAVSENFAGQMIDTTLNIVKAGLGDAGFNNLSFIDTQKSAPLAQGNLSQNVNGGNAGVIQYGSSDETIATVNQQTGYVTFLKQGQVNISATELETEFYLEQTLSYQLTIVNFRVVSIQSNDDAFAALKADGSVVTWGDDDQGGDSSGVQDQLKSVVSIHNNRYAFAAIKADGSVVTWGDENEGGNSSDVQAQLTNVVSIHHSRSAFAAIKADGSVVIWGDDFSGGDGTEVQDQLNSVVSIQSTIYSFAALKTDGSVVTWGYDDFGGNSSGVQATLTNVVSIESNYAAFAALKSDGSIVTWGSSGGGNSSLVQDKLTNVVSIQNNYFSFAALKADGSVVTWGSADKGGNSSTVVGQLNAVQSIQGTGYAFAALKIDGSVVTWGDDNYGANSSGVQAQLINVVSIQSTNSAFAALKSDGSVVTWGDDTYGGISSGVQAQLTNVVSIQSSPYAFAALKSDGSVVSWGWSSVGNSSGVQDQLNSVVSIQNTNFAFAALRADGSVVTWGSSGSGGYLFTKAASVSGNPTPAFDVDTDKDGTNNTDEWASCGTPYILNAGNWPCESPGFGDSDGDGVWDYVEKQNGTDHLQYNTSDKMSDINLDGYPDYYILPQQDLNIPLTGLQVQQ